MAQSIGSVIDFKNNDEVAVLLGDQKMPVLANVVEKGREKSIVTVSTIINDEAVPLAYTVPNNQIIQVIITAPFQFA